MESNRIQHCFVRSRGRAGKLGSESGLPRGVLRSRTGRVLGLALCLALGLSAEAAAAVSEKIPPDKVVHPLLKGVTAPRIIPESRKEPPYPERWWARRLGGRVILQAVVETSGGVRDITPLKAELSEEPDCGAGSGGGRSETHPVAPGRGTKENVPPDASRDFEAAAVSAVKQWKFLPGTQNGAPVDVYWTLIVEFSSCPRDADGTAAPNR
jgi:hypothetical protein